MQYVLQCGMIGSGVGPFEVMLLFVAVLLLFGADRLPEIVRTILKLMHELRKTAQDLQKEVLDIRDTVSKEAKDALSLPDDAAQKRSVPDEE